MNPMFKLARASPYPLIALALACLLPRTSDAANQSTAGDPLNDTLQIELGTYITSQSTTVQVNGSAQRFPGTPINLEHELGMGDTTRFRLDSFWRFTRRQKLRLLYFDLNRAASRSVDRDIQFGNTVFPVGATVHSDMSAQIAELAYEFDFLKGERYELGAILGVHNIRYSLQLSGMLQHAGSPVTLSQRATADGPMPVVGLAGIWRLSHSIYLEGEAEYFQVTVGDFSGHLSDYAASIVWQAFTHFGVGVGYDEFTSGFRVDGDRFDGDLRWRYGGVRAYIKGSF